jgi:hypothetical protein
VALTYNASGYSVGGTTYFYRSASLTASSQIQGHTATFTATATDNAANTTTTSNQTATWDSTGPTFTISATDTNVGYPGSGSTVYFKSGATTGSFTITAADTSGSGLYSTSFPAAPSGWTMTNGSDSATYTAIGATSGTSLSGISAADNAGNTTTDTVTITVDTNTLTQAPPVEHNGGTRETFSGTASYAGSVTVYYCTPTVTPCTSSSPGEASATTTASGGSWSIETGSGTVSSSHTYTSTAYETDADDVLLVSGTETFTP